ncbi:ribonuclease J [Priestia megaterium]|uniref:Ribonuclease J n=1 Tax=Priestia megaterium TaxID=1404 RepID=A0A6M6EAF9_PRIMG|nr:ribonuclease J [Priestia megaterium]QJX80545.1 RNase J family beta-CASP ribonuclease [Priestia megaterium]
MKNKIRIIPLGGLGEVGKNMTVVEYNDQMFIIDAGIIFPDEDMYGVDVITPDFEYVRQNKHKIKALFVTHGHEDHIGALPYFMKEFPKVPIYATKLTAGMITNKLKYHKVDRSVIRIIKSVNEVFTYNKVKVSFFGTIHSIPDSVGIVIETPIGNIVHTGDFKIDYHPVDKKFIDFQRLGEIGKQGVKVLLSDSTNAEKEGVSVPESIVAANLEKEVFQATGRTVVATFASSLHRVRSIIEISEKLGKKVVVVGKSMEKNIKLAIQLGHIVAKEETIIAQKEANDYPREQLLILATGAQGEVMAAVSRLSQDENKFFKLEKDDTVIFSSGVIPGNEKSVGSLINNLLKKQVKVVQKKEIHTSGHGYQEEQKLLLSILRPEYFIPCHGEYRMLVKHKELATQVGIKEENIFVFENGDVLEITSDGAAVGESVQAGPVLVDNSGLGDVNINIMRDRRRMAEQGLVVVFAKVYTKEKTVSVRFELKGIAARLDKPQLNKELAEAVESRLSSEKKEGTLRRALIDDFVDVVYKHIKRRPLIVPYIEFIRD